jgi:putative flavoprotein involved in K+ transport
MVHRMSDRIDCVVIGAGQAGLAVSRELARAGVEHVVLEQGRVGDTWRGRWESFCLVTPNWSVQLPDGEYEGDDPDGFLLRDEIVTHLERYAARIEAPVREGVEVTSVRPRADGNGFALDTSEGPVEARTVVVASGAYQRAHRPAPLAALPAELPQVDVAGYRSPDALPDGPVLVVGSGQSGAQIAEDLHDAGRDVFLACGRAPWVPRRIGDRDLFWWAVQTGFVDQPVEALPSPAARLEANLLATGRGGGHDLHLRTLQRMGVTLLGRLEGCEGRHARFAGDLGETLAWGDERYARLMGLVGKLVAERGWPPPVVPEPEPIATDAPESLDLSGFGAVVVAGGYRPDYQSWVDCPGAFDEFGFPLQVDGASTAAPGLYFVGVHFLRKRKSALLVGVGEDASVVAGTLSAGL